MLTLLCLAVSGGPAAAADGDPTAAEPVVAPAPFAAPNDGVFVDAMTVHHHFVLELTNEEIARGSNPDVIALARRLRDARTEEITRMAGIRAELGARSIVVVAHDPHLDADRAALVNATAKDLDRVFLDHLLAHDAEVMVMAHYALPQLTNSELRRLATGLVDAHAREIGELRTLLGDLQPPQDPS